MIVSRDGGAEKPTGGVSDYVEITTSAGDALVQSSGILLTFTSRTHQS